MPTLTELDGLLNVRVTGNVTTLEEDVPLVPTAETVAANCWPDKALSATVAGWPTLMSPTSASAMSQVTSNWERSVSVMKALDESEEEELALLDAADAPVPVPVVPEEEGELPVLTELVPAFTLWPTEPLTAVTVPAAGAMSVVLSTAV